MRRLTLLMLLCAPTLEYLAGGDKFGRGGWLPDKADFGLELFGVLALLYVVFAGLRSRFELVRPAYWLVFGALAVTASCGILAAATEPGPIFAGLRNYLRALPWFFVPAVFLYSERDVRKQLKVLLGVAVVQVPIAVWQRLESGGSGMSGDYITGTIHISSILSIFLICAACLLAGLAIRKHLKWLSFWVLISLILTPTTINETKGTLILLPIGLLMTYLVAARRGQRLKQMFIAVWALVIFGAAFVPAYDYFENQQERPRPIAEFVTQEGRLKNYLWRDEGLGTLKDPGKGDSITVALEYLSREPSTLAFGLGLGNASSSGFGEGFEGRYAALFEPFLSTAFARIVLELGVLGFVFLMCLLGLIFTDARYVAARAPGIKGALAAGWAGVGMVIAVSIFYKDITAHASLSLPFWYFSGLVAAERMRFALGHEAVEHRTGALGLKPAAE
jgi:cell division protein FtsW (lipid II flippase)